jgi:cytochrome c556
MPNPAARLINRHLAALLLTLPLAAQPALTAAEPSATAASSHRDVVIARRNLMAAIGRNMDGITGMVEPGGKIDPADAAEHADEIAVMLMAFPHLFPPGSDNWSATNERDDPAGVTEAAPTVWREMTPFTASAQAASRIATAASRSANADQFRLRAQALQSACDSCHARYRREEKPYIIPIAPVSPGNQK